MADLSIVFAGIKAPNPFWLASAPPTDKAYNVVRAFEAGWGGVVWKTLGEDPAAVNVSSRYSAHYGANREVLGINNIELITDRSLEINLREITQVKKDWPDRALIVSLLFWLQIGSCHVLRNTHPTMGSCNRSLSVSSSYSPSR